MMATEKQIQSSTLRNVNVIVRVDYVIDWLGKRFGVHCVCSCHGKISKSLMFSTYHLVSLTSIFYQIACISKAWFYHIFQNIESKELQVFSFV